jgi:hypothetical protein
MNIDWEVIKTRAKAAYLVATQVFVFQLVSFYLLGCLVALAPLGPRGYVDFVDYCFHWHADRKPAAPAVREAAGVTHGKPKN